MSKTQKIIFAAFMAVVLLLTYLEATEPKPINWNISYASTDKIPLGTFVLFENLKQHPEISLNTINRPPYEKLTTDSISGTYFFLNQSAPFDEAELDKILSWVEKGNNLFVSAKYVSKNLLDTLNLETEEIFSTETVHTKPLLQLANKSLNHKEAYLFNHNTNITVFSKIDTAKTKILGFSEPYKDDLEPVAPEINFIETNFGNGKITLHLAPEAFSNYFLLSEERNINYTQAALSYINKNEIIYWDNYYKAGKTFYSSPLYILLSNRQLKWAYYFAIAGCLLFIIFEGKRKQRSIPIVKPLENQTYNYTRTIAGLYLDKKQYKEIASKKIKLFLEYIRFQYRMSTLKIDQEFIETLASRSGNSVEDTKTLFDFIAQIEAKPNLNKQDLLNLSKEINTFKNR